MYNKSTWPLLWPATGCSLGPANPLAITHRNSIVHCTITISWNLAVKEPISGTFHIMHLLLRLTQCYTLPNPGIFLSAIYNPPCWVVRLTTVRTGLIYLWQWWKVFEDVKDLVCLLVEAGRKVLLGRIEKCSSSLLRRRIGYIISIYPPPSFCSTSVSVKSRVFLWLFRRGSIRHCRVGAPCTKEHDSRYGSAQSPHLSICSQSGKKRGSRAGPRQLHQGQKSNFSAPKKCVVLL